MAENKTRPTEVDVDAYLETISEPRRSQGRIILDLMERISGERPVMWGPSMIGFGTYHYKGKTTSGESFVIGFSPRKPALTLYGIYNDYAPKNPLFDSLGPHTVGKSCLYLKSLDGIDMDVLERLTQQSWEYWSTHPAE